MTTNQVSKPQVIVAQLGARMHYAVPIALYRGEMLARFFTDIYLGRGSNWRIISQLGALLPKTWRPMVIKQLMARREDGLPAKKVKSFNLLGMSYAIALRGTTDKRRDQIHLDYGHRFCQKIIATTETRADAIYAYPGAALSLFKLAREKGIYPFLEQFALPWSIEHKIIQQEKDYWPGWQMEFQANRSKVPERIQQEEWRAAEAIICPSDFVVQALMKMGVPSNKIRLIPYSLDIKRFTITRALWDGRRPLRILFVGAVTLSKGVQYLYQAMQLLHSPEVTARLVGPIFICEPYLARMKKYGEFVGMVSRSEIFNHYAWADLFVFPSLAEGSATVTYEALASGLPVITTPNAGSVVRDGVEGFIVPIRDGAAIAEKIELLRKTPELLAIMSQNARQRAAEFSWKNYSKRLTNVIVEVLQ